MRWLKGDSERSSLASLLASLVVSCSTNDAGTALLARSSYTRGRERGRDRSPLSLAIFLLQKEKKMAAKSTRMDEPSHAACWLRFVSAFSICGGEREERRTPPPPPTLFRTAASVQPGPWILLGSDPIGPVTQQGSQSLDKGKLVLFLSPPRPAQERRKGLTPVLTDSFCLPRRPKTVYYAGLRQKERQESLCQNGRKEDP